MKSMNRVFLMGRLGGDPELLESKTGNHYTRLRLATQKLVSKADGTKSEVPEWHSVFVWGKQAETCAQYLQKGALVFVEGALSYWTANGGDEKMIRTSISADQVHFLNTRRSTEAPVTPAPEPSLDNPEAPRNHDAVAHPVLM
jgi:single-strand DNA-binding protein